MIEDSKDMTCESYENLLSPVGIIIGGKTLTLSEGKLKSESRSITLRLLDDTADEFEMQMDQIKESFSSKYPDSHFGDQFFKRSDGVIDACFSVRNLMVDNDLKVKSYDYWGNEINSGISLSEGTVCRFQYDIHILTSKELNSAMATFDVHAVQIPKVQAGDFPNMSEEADAINNYNELLGTIGLP